VAESKRKADESLPTLGRDLVTLVIEYIKQETIDPVRGLGRFLAFSLAAVVVGGLGTILLVLGVIRLLQAETGSTFRGHLSFLPYLIAMVLTLVVIGGAVLGTKSKAPKGEL
jgi:flagellar biosynthesis protein FliQ